MANHMRTNNQIRDTHNGNMRSARSLSAVERGESRYIYDNTARELAPETEVRKKNSKQIAPAPSHKKRARHSAMNLPYVMFLIMAVAATCIMCMRYIKLQSSIVSHVKTISAMEMDLSELKAENDDLEARIKGAVDLEEIKRRAMDELGMTYAREDQIVEYNSDGTDYVRQFITIDE